MGGKGGACKARRVWLEERVMCGKGDVCGEGEGIHGKAGCVW